MVFKNIGSLLCVVFLIGCVSNIQIKDEYTAEVDDCNINVTDKRVQKYVFPAPAGMSRMSSYPLDKMVRNRLCQTGYSNLEIDIEIILAHCSVSTVAIAEVKGYVSGVQSSINGFSTGGGDNAILASTQCTENIHSAVDDFVYNVQRVLAIKFDSNT